MERSDAGAIRMATLHRLVELLGIADQDDCRRGLRNGQDIREFEDLCTSFQDGYGVVQSQPLSVEKSTRLRTGSRSAMEVTG